MLASRVRGVERGRPEYHIVPLYFPRVIGPPSARDFLLRGRETNFGVPLYAALWNAPPILQVDLGKQLGRIVSDEAMRDLRDALLMQLDPFITVAWGRLGIEEPRPIVEDWRSRERMAWLPLTGRALVAPVA